MTGWYGAYGGYTTLSTDCAHTGSRSLKYSGRQQSWYTPAINLYETFQNNGAGRYRISMWVRTNIVNLSNPNIRMLIRGWEENSFITQQGSNYFYTLTSPVRMSAGDWQYLSGTVDVLASDISANTGIFTLALDYLGTANGQVLYIDDFCVEKETVGVGYVYFEKSLYRFKPYQNSGNSSYSVKAHVSPPNADNQTIRYESSNTLVVSVNENTGQVFTGIPGDATITAYLVSNPNKKSICRVSVKYELSVRHYYDQGFYVRHGNTISSIASDHQFLSNVLNTELNVYVTNEGTFHYSSTADNCKGVINSSNLDTMCTSHSPSCTNGYYMHEVFNRDIHSAQNTHVNILWSGHKTERGNNSKNVDISFTALYEDGGAEILMLNKIAQYYKLILLHETGHTLNAPDHYHEWLLNPITNEWECKNSDICSRCGTVEKRGFYCVMNEWIYLDGFTENFFCDLCEQDMFQHLNEHH